GLVRHLARQVLDMDGPLPAALFAESPHLSDAELDELDAIINAAEGEQEDKA
ncbi:MAG: CopY family transcriptional regulator, partial [Hyphomonas sp.]